MSKKEQKTEGGLRNLYINITCALCGHQWKEPISIPDNCEQVKSFTVQCPQDGYKMQIQITFEEDNEE